MPLTSKVTVIAARTGKQIEVTISMMLPNSCYKAEVAGTYPGDRIYITDPGAAQVFIDVTRTTNAFCPMSLVPWIRTLNIVDSNHDKVEVFINGREEAEVPVAIVERYIVLKPLNPEISGFCTIHPYGQSYLMIYRQVFGPETYENCAAWIKQNCQIDAALSSALFSDGWAPYPQ